MIVNDGLPATIVNPAFPFGWGDVGPTPTGGIVKTLLQGMPVYFAGGFNAVGVRDVAMGHWLGCLYGRVGRRYILGGDNLTYEAFTRKVAELAGIRPPMLRLPVGAFRLLGRVGDFVADHITHKTPLAAETSVTYAAGRYLYFDVSRAKQELGYAPAPVDDHIRDAIRWFSRGRA